MTEEYLARFGPAMSRLFDIPWTERSFLLVFAFLGPAIYALTAMGSSASAAAGFVAWFIFTPGRGVHHFIFPLLARGGAASTATWGCRTTGSRHRHYFPGLYTAVLPDPGIWAIRRLAFGGSSR
jgi:hypothetical protein